MFPLSFPLPALLLNAFNKVIINESITHVSFHLSVFPPPTNLPTCTVSLTSGPSLQVYAGRQLPQGEASVLITVAVLGELLGASPRFQPAPEELPQRPCLPLAQRPAGVHVQALKVPPQRPLWRRRLKHGGAGGGVGLGGGGGLDGGGGGGGHRG